MYSFSGFLLKGCWNLCLTIILIEYKTLQKKKKNTRLFTCVTHTIKTLKRKTFIFPIFLIKEFKILCSYSFPKYLDYNYE